MVRKNKTKFVPEPADTGLTDAAAIEFALDLHQAERRKPQTSELELWGALVRANDGDPEEILRRWVENTTQRGAEAGSRVAALLEVKRERQRSGKKALSFLRENEAQRKMLQRALKELALFRVGYIRDPEKKHSLTDALIEGSWAMFRRGPNVVLLPWNSAADNARYEAVKRFLADRAERVRVEAEGPDKRKCPTRKT